MLSPFFFEITIALHSHVERIYAARQDGKVLFQHSALHGGKGQENSFTNFALSLRSWFWNPKTGSLLGWCLIQSLRSVVVWNHLQICLHMTIVTGECCQYFQIWMKSRCINIWIPEKSQPAMRDGMANYSIIKDKLTDVTSDQCQWYEQTLLQLHPG